MPRYQVNGQNYQADMPAEALTMVSQPSEEVTQMPQAAPRLPNSWRWRKRQAYLLRAAYDDLDPYELADLWSKL